MIRSARASLVSSPARARPAAFGVEIDHRGRAFLRGATYTQGASASDRTLWALLEGGKLTTSGAPSPFSEVLDLETMLARPASTYTHTVVTAISGARAFRIERVELDGVSHYEKTLGVLSEAPVRSPFPVAKDEEVTGGDARDGLLSVLVGAPDADARILVSNDNVRSRRSRERSPAPRSAADDLS